MKTDILQNHYIILVNQKNQKIIIISYNDMQNDNFRKNFGIKFTNNYFLTEFQLNFKT